LSPHGFFWSPVDSASLRAPLRIPGFRPVAGSGEPVPLLWAARFGGALLGRRIVLDPEGGGEDAAGVGPLGTRAATLNLESARILSRLLEGAGARVRLTREGDFALSEVERVQVAERFAPDRVLRIGHGAGPPRLGYYFSSLAGRRWAEGTSRWLAAMGVADSVAPLEDAHYVVQQTSCPALRVSAIPLDEVGERRLLEPASLRREAYALLVALAADLAPPSASWAVDELALERAAGGPASHALVEIGGTVLMADRAGLVRWVRGEPGALDVAVHQHGRVVPVGVLLDSVRGSRFALPP
jgi:N-acetylmuramoyl-L-alanine amidase